jgi:hypothetical protein
LTHNYNALKRGLGIYQIIGTKEYLEIIFVGGEFSVKVGYPNRLDKLFDTKKETTRRN